MTLARDGVLKNPVMSGATAGTSGLSKSLVVSEISDFVGEVKGTMLYPRNPKPVAQSFMQIVSERISSQTD